jgi:putative endonuclease
MTAAHLIRGQRGELFAANWLVARGLQHICSNFRCRLGELDLVMRDIQDKGCLVIVEVRFRSNPGYGGSLASVTAAKQRRIALTTQFFLQRQRSLQKLPLRFDVLALTGDHTNPLVDWRKHAFVFDD